MEQRIQNIPAANPELNVGQTLFDRDKLLQMIAIALPELLQGYGNVNAKEVVTLRVFIDEYKNFIKQNRSEAYFSSVDSSFKKLVEFFGVQKPIATIQLREVEQFLNYVKTKVTKGYRVYFKTLKAAFNKAVEWNYIKENPFCRVKLPKRQEVKPGFIKNEELKRIKSKLKTQVLKDFVTVAFNTGMRLNEIVNLRWSNVDFGARLITVGDEQFTTKARNQRMIPICEEVLETLKRIENMDFGIRIEKQKAKKMNDFIFCKENGERYSGDYVSKSFKKACKAAGIDKSIHFHSLRHSFASNLVQNGVPLYTVKDLLGHSTIKTTEIYSHLNLDSLREAIEKLDTVNSHTPAPSEPPLSRGELNEVKIYKISTGGL
ncbi:MAG: tyrosine-type recombinase/integrase [Melioribacteraceae bacterium]